MHSEIRLPFVSYGRYTRFERKRTKICSKQTPAKLLRYKAGKMNIHCSLREGNIKEIVNY